MCNTSSCTAYAPIRQKVQQTQSGFSERKTAGLHKTAPAVGVPTTGAVCRECITFLLFLFRQAGKLPAGARYSGTRPGRSTVCLCWYPAVQPTRPGGRGLGRRAHAPIWRPPVVSRPYARQHGFASVPVGGVPRRCESRLAPDKSKYNHGSLLTRRRYLKRRILRRADSAKLHFLRPGMTGLCVSPDLKRNKPRGSSAYAKPPGARMNRKGNAGMFPCSFQMTLRNAWLKPCRAPVSP